MKITADTITAQSVLELRVALSKAAQDAFALQLFIERSEITPADAAVKLTQLLQPLQMDSDALIEARSAAAYWRDVAAGSFAGSAVLPWEATGKESA